MVDFTELDNKFPIEKDMVLEEVLSDEEIDQTKKYEECVTDIELVENKLGEIKEVLDSGDVNSIIKVVEESRTLLNELSGAHGLENPEKVSMESVDLAPFSMLQYHSESFLDVVKDILFKIKNFLMYIGRQLKQMAEKVYWYMLDIPGDAKELSSKIENSLHGNEMLNDTYGEQIISWLNRVYPSFRYLASMGLSANPGPNGISKMILGMSQKDILAEIPELTDLSIGSSEKFSEEMINFYRTSDIDVSKQYFKNFELIRSNILTLEDIDVNKYKDVDVFVYNVDPKFIYYIIFTMNSSNQLRTLMGKARLESFRAPQIRALQLAASDANVILKGKPVEYIKVLLDEIISGAPKTAKMINRIPGVIRTIESDLRDNIKLFDSHGSQGEIVTNLKTYSGFLKNLMRKYYRDVMLSTMSTYLFYYKFSSVVYSGLVGSKNS